MLLPFLKYEFLQNAIITSFLASIICGIIGVITVEKKLIMMSGGIAHTAYGGVGLGFLTGFNPMICAGLFSVSSAVIIGSIRRRNNINSDIIISILWSLGMALGIAFTGLMPGYPPDMNSYLFGNILSVTKNELNIMFVLTLIIVFSIFIFFNDWKAYLFDAEFSKISGIKTVFFEYTILILTAISIVVLIRAVGIILIIALLSAPAASAALITKRLKSRMIIATIFSFLFCIIGLILSYNLNFASGAAIVFVAGATYFIMLISKKFIFKNM